MAIAYCMHVKILDKQAKKEEEDIIRKARGLVFASNSQYLK